MFQKRTIANISETVKFPYDGSPIEGPGFNLRELMYDFKIEALVYFLPNL